MDNIEIHLQKMSEGDQKAFEKVLYYYEKPIYNHLLRLTKDPDDAAELLQDTFIKIYTKRGEITDPAYFKNWLYKVATNTAFDFFRKKKREKTISLEEDELTETIEDDSSYTTTENSILAHDLEKALGDIRPHYRNILLLYYKEGFDYQEISEILEIPLNTVKTWLRRGRTELSTLLKKTYG